MKINEHENRYSIETMKEQLLRERKSHSYTQDVLAKLIGVSKKSIINWEDTQCKGSPDLKNILKLCDCFDCDIDHLFGILESKSYDEKNASEFTGLYENDISAIRHMGPKQKAILHGIINSPELLNLIFRYGDMLGSDYIRVGGFVDDTEYVEFKLRSANVADTSISQDIIKQALLVKIKSELDKMSWNEVFNFFDSKSKDLFNSIPAHDQTADSRSPGSAAGTLRDAEDISQGSGSSGHTEAVRDDQNRDLAAEPIISPDTN